MRSIAFQLVVVVLSSGFLTREAAAQCQLEWSSGGPQPQLSGQGRCSTQWDPDGAGPLPQRLVVGGSSLTGGAAPSNQRVMTWDGSLWQALGSGPGNNVNGSVNALTTWNGLLVAGGSFTGAGTDYIALWSGSQWQPIGTGFPVGVQHLTEWNGNLVAMSQTGGVPIIRLWNGVSWTALPTPPSLMFPSAVVSYQGFLCVAGVENSPTQGVLERWNGTSWQPSIFAQAAINCMAVRPSIIFGGADQLYVGGSFLSIGGTTASRIAGTSGGASFTWSAIGVGLSSTCNALLARNSGLTGLTLIALTSSTTASVMRYTVTPPGSGTWTSIGNPAINSLAYYGGYHATSSATLDNAFQRYDGSAWVPVSGPGIDGEVRTATRFGNDMIVGGTFLNVSGTPMSRIASWDGTTFQPLGPGVTGTSVDALLTLDDGDVVAGGLFLQAGPTALNHMGRWNGTSWSAFGSGFDQQVLAICKMPNGDLIAGGKFAVAGGVPCARIARWNGTAWSALGSGMNSDVMALAVRGDGVLFAGGSFTTAGGVACNRVAQWTGTAWIQVGAGFNGDVHAMAVRPNDDVVAVGAFTSAGGLPASRCARWDGAAWLAMGAASGDPSIARAVYALPNGDVLAGRGFHEPTTNPDAGISRWNGTSWSGVDSGLGGHYLTVPVAVRTFALRANGELVAGGSFSSAGGFGSKNLAILTSTCPASAVPYGSGCSSAAGPLSITADTLPWIGAPFRTTTTGVAPVSLCLGIIGLTQVSLPLDLLLGEGQPGCSLLASLEILMVLQNGPGTAHSSFSLAPDPSLIGVPFFQQTIPFELDGTGAIAAIRGSNALAATIGSF